MLENLEREKKALDYTKIREADKIAYIERQQAVMLSWLYSCREEVKKLKRSKLKLIKGGKSDFP